MEIFAGSTSVTDRRFGVSTVTSGDETMVSVRGELDVCTAPVLERELTAGPAGDARSIVVDLDRVEFVDLSGLRPIIRLALSERPGQSVSITAGSRPVQTLLDLTGLRRQLHILGPDGPALTY